MAVTHTFTCCSYILVSPLIPYLFLLMCFCFITRALYEYSIMQTLKNGFTRDIFRALQIDKTIKDNIQLCTNSYTLQIMATPMNFFLSHLFPSTLFFWSRSILHSILFQCSHFNWAFRAYTSTEILATFTAYTLMDTPIKIFYLKLFLGVSTSKRLFNFFSTLS